MKANRSAGAGLGRNVTGARPLGRVLRWGKNMALGEVGFGSPRGEVAQAGDAVVVLL